MRLVATIVLVCFSLGLVAGCGGPSKNDFVQTVEMDHLANIRKDLEAIAKSGRLGSGFGVLMSNVRDFKKKDAAKGEAIESALKQLQDLDSEAKVKAKAQEILKTL